MSDKSEEWYFFELMSFYSVKLSSKIALMLYRNIILLCVILFGLIEEFYLVKSLSNLLFICNC